MKVLVMSDTHYENEIMIDIINRYKGKVDLMVHCGDSSLECNDPLLKDFDIVVKGNHDYDDFPPYVAHPPLLVAHGHLHDIYHGYDQLMTLCKENDCYICCYGHTHIPYYEVVEGIHFINPGAVLINRGPYGYGTYVILTINNDRVKVDYYHHTTHQKVDHIVLPEGRKTMVEIKQLVAQIDAQMAAKKE